MAATRVKLVSRIKPRLPEKWKGGKIEKMANYVHVILRDYHMVYTDTIQYMRDHRLKSSMWLSLLGTSGALIATNPSPSKEDYEAQLVEQHNDIGIVGDPIKNPESLNYLRKMFVAHKNSKLKFHNLYLFSLARIDVASTQVDLFASKCKQNKPHWKEFHKSIVDVCVFGHWINLEKAMKDYDVNPSEWEN
ncbi:mitochondrial import inner membrane translocase subunit Tim29-like [Pecten maximus]|uniref:mitochondrial import inner membrane translocase subunit Tim29-like n=1 Tax=Pecten maximus TaxID=6579 RepID=UPI00145817F0|nr:mitochondrial import inner membrane translocase subunit Tim29-like [Pecten maximus]